MALEAAPADYRPPPHIDAGTFNELRLRLEHERLRLRAALASAARRPELAERGEPADFGDLALRHGPDDTSESLHAMHHDQLTAVERALARMEAGTYGVDEHGEPIPVERLRVLPWAIS